MVFTSIVMSVLGNSKSGWKPKTSRSLNALRIFDQWSVGKQLPRLIYFYVGA